MQKNAVEYLLSLSDFCDKTGSTVIADKIDGLIKDKSFVKVAQYVGVINYNLKNSRCLSNCIRKNRLSSDAPMQEIIMGCLKEYQDGQKYYDDEWVGKYASAEMTKYADQWMSDCLKNGIDVVTASNGLIENLSRQNDIGSDIEKVSEVWKEIEKTPLCKNAIFKDFEAVVKQAGIWQGIKDVGKGIGQAANWAGNAISNQWNKHQYNKNYSQVIAELTKQVQSLYSDVNEANSQINMVVRNIPFLKQKYPALAEAADKFMTDWNGKQPFNAIWADLKHLLQASGVTTAPDPTGPETPPVGPQNATQTEMLSVPPENPVVPFGAGTEEEFGAGINEVFPPAASPPAPVPATVPVAAPAVAPAVATPATKRVPRKRKVLPKQYKGVKPSRAETEIFSRKPAGQRVSSSWLYFYKEAGTDIRVVFNSFRKINETIRSMYQKMQELSAIPDIANKAGNEINGLNQAIQTAGTNPFDPAGITALNAALKTLDTKLRAQLSGQKPAATGVPQPTAAPTATQVPPVSPGVPGASPPAGGGLMSIQQILDTARNSLTPEQRADLIRMLQAI